MVTSAQASSATRPIDIRPPDDVSNPDQHQQGPALGEVERVYSSRALAPPNIGGGAWVAQGPGPAISGQVENILPNNEVSGAIHTAVSHPTDPDILWVGATNGGIWKTVNATAASPSWTPLTDAQTSLSIGAMELDPSDPTANTLIAGIGLYSSFAQYGGLRTGLLRTVDGGGSWAPINGGGALSTLNISGVAPRGSTIVVSVNDSNAFTCADIGAWRSIDTGVSFTKLSTPSGLPDGVASDLAGDPSNASVLFTGITYASGCTAAVLNNGIYRSNDTGLTWSKVSTAAMDSFIIDGVTNNIEIAANGLNVFVNIVQQGRSAAVFYSWDGGTSWVAMDLPRTPEGAPLTITNLTPGTPITVDTNPVPHQLTTGMEAEVSGVGGTVGANGVWTITQVSTTTFSLNGSSDTSPWSPATGNCVKVVGMNPKVKPGSQGGIHASILADPFQPTVYLGGDRQDYPFPNYLGALDYSGRLFRGNSGIAPTGTIPSPQWEHLTHFSSVPTIPGGGTVSSSAPHADSREMIFDAAENLIEVDDGGVYRRTSPTTNTGDWFSINGDIQVTEIHDVAYDAVSDVIISGNQDTGTTQQLSPSSLVWDSIHTADGGDVAVDDLSLGGVSTRYSSFQFLSSFRRRDYNASNVLLGQAFLTLTTTPPDVPLLASFLTPVELNRNTPIRLVIGGCNAVYESFDQGDNLVQISGLSDPGCSSGGLFSFPQNAITYGGRSGGSNSDDVLLVGTGQDLYLRTAPYPAQLTQVASYPGSALIRDVVLDTQQWQNLFVIDTTKVYWSSNAGVNWTDITGNLTDPGLESAAFIEGALGVPDALVIGGRDGVFQLNLPPAGPYGWGELGTGLPNAPVWDLEYETTNGKLVAGTLGRSAWVLKLSSLLSVQLAGSGSGLVTSNPAALSCDPTCSALVPHGVTVTLTATPDAGSTFIKWSGDADCQDGSVTVNADVSCTATFELNSVIIFMDGFESGDVSAWSNAVP